MRRGVTFLVCLLWLGGSALGQSGATGGPREQCQRLKNSMSTASQLRLGSAQEKFTSLLVRDRREKMRDIRGLAENTARQFFPTAQGGQVQALAALLLVDWAGRQQFDLMNLKQAAHPGRWSGKDETEIEIARLRYEELRGQVELTLQEADRLLREQGEGLSTVLKNF